jgi:hypothetical protein
MFLARIYLAAEDMFLKGYAVYRFGARETDLVKGKSPFGVFWTRRFEGRCYSLPNKLVFFGGTS